MSLSVARLENPAHVVPGLPLAGDLADIWLAHALASLLELTDEAPEGSADGDVDACRRAVMFAALALEMRLNSVLHRCDPEERHALSHLAPAERFRLAPRLLAELSAEAEDAALCELVVEVFSTRDALVGANGTERPLDPAFARAIVEESARICTFLATLVHDVPTATAVQVRTEVSALAERSERLSAGEPVSLPHWDWDWDEFPPDLVGS
jgi:hypothetical protein